MPNFTVYFDASGNHVDKDAIFVAGFVGEDAQWRRFHDEWLALLDQHGLDNPFHMTEFMTANTNGQYSGWAGKQGAFGVPAIQLIKRRICKDVSQGLVVPDFNRLHMEYLIPASHHLGSTINKPFAYCGFSAVLQVLLWELRRKSSGRKVSRIRYVFDRGDKHRGELASALKELLDIDAEFEDKTNFPGIQAADMLAWAHRRAVSYHRAGRDVAPDAYAEMSRHMPGAREWVYGSWEKLNAYCLEEGFKRRTG